MLRRTTARTRTISQVVNDAREVGVTMMMFGISSAKDGVSRGPKYWHVRIADMLFFFSKEPTEDRMWASLQLLEDALPHRDRLAIYWDDNAFGVFFAPEVRASYEAFCAQAAAAAS